MQTMVTVVVTVEEALVPKTIQMAARIRMMIISHQITLLITKMTTGPMTT